jgi:hypothetical protein
MTTVLTCISPEAAQAVATEANKAGDPAHWAIAAGCAVTLTYFDKRFPMDVAEWAHDNGHAEDAEADRRILGVEVIGDRDWLDGLASLAMQGRLAVVPRKDAKPSPKTGLPSVAP